jgi:hypothetical protein
MDMDLRDLERGRHLDRVFLDMMVAHHQGAIEMARVELLRGANPTLRRLAEKVIADQSQEIIEMNAILARRFGRPGLGETPSQPGTMAGNRDRACGRLDRIAAELARECPGRR